jgi:hypothetical protein
MEGPSALTIAPSRFISLLLLKLKSLHRKFNLWERLPAFVACTSAE